MYKSILNLQLQLSFRQRDDETFYSKCLIALLLTYRMRS